MLSSLSPYELLTASKPKPTSTFSTFSTSYDLYSIANHDQADIHPNLSHNDLPIHNSENTTPLEHSHQINKRTHYIADIHAHHNAVNRFSQRNQL